MEDLVALKEETGRLACPLARQILPLFLLRPNWNAKLCTLAFQRLHSLHPSWDFVCALRSRAIGEATNAIPMFETLSQNCGR